MEWFRTAMLRLARPSLVAFAVLELGAVALAVSGQYDPALMVGGTASLLVFPALGAAMARPRAGALDDAFGDAYAGPRTRPAPPPMHQRDDEPRATRRAGD